MRILLLVSFVLSFLASAGQSSDYNDRPKIVVGIMVDQMRQEYVYRYYDKFGEGGFKRLLKDGFSLQNAHYNYIPTLTGPGHASVYAGTTPAYHGIIGNEWYEKTLKKTVYCTDDDSVNTVGSASLTKGKMSPRRMLTTTITDELKLFTQKKAKVVGLSIKDRGSILSAGHTADAAYWYDELTGRMITSTFYMDKLPDWVEKFNALKLPDKYLGGAWNTLLPMDKYVESGPDNSAYEKLYNGPARSTFPYDLKALRKANNNFDLLSLTPFSDDYLTEMAKAALDGEKMGMDEWTDFLCISYSAPDKIGHQVGPNSVELQDVYMRLDRNIEDLLKKLDQTAGEGNYLVFLTADHAVADVPRYLVDSKIPAGYISMNQLNVKFGSFFMQYFQGRKIIEAISDEQIYLDHEVFSNDPKTGGVDLMVTMELVSNFLLQQEGISHAYSKNVLRQGDFNEGGIKGMAIRGFHEKRSGDVLMVWEPGWTDLRSTHGTTHGSPYPYDTHVPVIFFGFGIKPGSSVALHSITDIAPTLSVLLKIKFPNGCTGQPIEEIFGK